ncbi:unnamed protein product [Amaranthus hypochondriacus]
MADAILYGIAEDILKNVGSYMVGEIASAWGFKSDLDKLKLNVDIIKAFLVDAEKRQTDNEAVRLWLIKLTQVVYAADDLFDEFITVATRKQLNGRNKFSNEVHTFFSRYNQIAYAHRIARKIKVLRNELEGIVKEGKDLELVSQSYVEGRLITKRRDQSYSFVEADQVIGRDADKNAILDLLLASSSSGTDEHEHEQRVLPVIVIVGIGGLGKTALAQYIYNDPSVDEFFDLKLWVCVSDVFDVKEITEKILKSVTNSETPKLEMDQLQSRLRNEIGDQKYLLVLDDVWNESREEWLKMRALLKIGKNGSKILVTTRSSKVAKIMCTFPTPYDLQGLSEEKSWELFEKLAFMPGQAQQMPHLVDIGKEMVRKCANVPLAIRIIGSILYGEDESKWLSIRDKNLSKLSDNGNDHIINILKISYHHLASPLKNCFAYCALFPKDYNINKDMLINLWMAEGFIVLAADESMSLEELGEEYFLTLLQRGLFQDVKKDEWGCIESCKMHDFIHDLAQDVAESKCLVIKADPSFHQNNIYHLSFAFRLNFQRTIPSTVLSLRRLRTLLLPQQQSDGSTFGKVMCQQIISKITYLRVLDLHALGLKDLPGSIGKLIHLRYLNLSSNPFLVLPDSITELHNLQTLNLNNCSMLCELPSKIEKLVNLRSFDIDHCFPFFLYTPLGIGNLTCLHYLPRFIVSMHANSARLSELYKLKNLRGKLQIVFNDHLKSTMLEAGEGELTNKHGLNELEIHFAMGECDWLGDLDKIVIPPEADSEHDEVVLEGLKPHRNLRKLIISHYQGRKLPYWAMNNSLVDTLSKLVEIELYKWNHCQLPAFSQLPLLKQLSLTRVLCLEYMEILNSDHSSSTIDRLFYPSLEILKLHNMISLKGWWKGSDASSSELGLAQPSLSFPRLLILDVQYCENLTSLPTCPNVEKVHLSNKTKNMSILNIVTKSSRLKSLTIDNVEDLLSIHSECLLELSWLRIKDSALLSTEKLGGLFAALSSSLKYLSFNDCKNLISISKGLEHLTALKTLAIVSCDQLDLSPNERQLENENRDEYCTSSAEMPWKAFKTSLRSLSLLRLGKLVSLPSELQHLTNLRALELSFLELRELPEWINCFSSLEYLELRSCHEVTCLPESFPKLATLQELRIVYCEKLRKRCGGPNGKDWTKIKHIPLVIVNDYDSVIEEQQEKFHEARLIEENGTPSSFVYSNLCW